MNYALNRKLGQMQDWSKIKTNLDNHGLVKTIIGISLHTGCEQINNAR